MKLIKLTKGQFALVDDEDYKQLNRFKWIASTSKIRNTYYARRAMLDCNGKQKIVQMHRIIMGITNPKIIIDHKDGNGLNNQRNNLRVCSHSQNSSNRKSAKNSSSKYLGVTFCKENGKWRAQIRKFNVNHHIGYFIDEKNAALAYQSKAKEIHGEFANLSTII